MVFGGSYTKKNLTDRYYSNPTDQRNHHLRNGNFALPCKLSSRKMKKNIYVKTAVTK